MRSISNEKMEQLLENLNTLGIDVLLLYDFEMSRDINLHYISGHPMDAILVLTSHGDIALIPWDINLAKEHSEVDDIIDVTKYGKSNMAASAMYIKEKINKSNPIVAVNESIPYSYVVQFEQRIEGVEIYKKPKEISNLLNTIRSTKTQFEMKRIDDVAKLSNKLIKDIQKFVMSIGNQTENDLSFHVMKKMREYGAEDNSFPSLVANASRSHQIHCFPYSSNNILSDQGLALIDFGAKLNGYCSDVTIPFTFGNLTSEQEKIKKTVLKAYEAAINSIDIGVPLWKIHQSASDVIENAGYKFLTALGHGLGLSEHDSPIISSKPKDPQYLANWQEKVVENGMVFTIEPGVYLAGHGGCRLENDVMIRDDKIEILTKAELIEIT
jgi:Xaa-Pro aminopeptidase